MAIYYMNVKTIGGNKGRSSIGAAAYRAGERLRNENDGITHDYTKRRGAVSASAYRSGQELNTHDFTHKRGIVHSEIMLPNYAPVTFRDRGTLWNAAEQSERNRNARTGREVVVALPNELSTEQQVIIVRDYVQRNFVDKGMCADFSVHSGHIHSRKNEAYPFQDLTVRKENPHAHIQLTVRPLNRNGTWGAKSKKEYILDREGKRIKLPSGNWKSRKIDATDWDKTDTLVKWREDWAVTVNREFGRLNIPERIDHRTLKAQGINREPTKHMGHEAWNLEKKGIKTDIGNTNRGIMERNRALEQQEKQARAKLASVQQKQKEHQEPTAQAVAEHMNKLNDDYITLKKYVSDTQSVSQQRRHQLVKMESYIKSMQQRTEDIYKQYNNLQNARTVRDGMERTQSKKAIELHIQQLENTYRRSWDYYQRTYNVSPDKAQQEIKRLHQEYQKAHTSYCTEVPQDISRYTKRLREYEIEYKKDRLFAEVRPDSQEILQALNRADMQLQRITDDDFKEITRNMTPQQAEMLRQQRYNRERVRNNHGFVR